jgi:hypothetical protein
MYYLVSVDHNGMAMHLTICDCEGFKKCCISNAMDGTDDMLWNGSKDDVNVRSECKEDEGTDCEDGDSDTIGKGRQILTCVVY